MTIFSLSKNLLISICAIFFLSNCGLEGIDATQNSNLTDCNCGDKSEPVCSTDGVIYNNPCEAQCAGVGYTLGVCSVESEAVVYQSPNCGYYLFVSPVEYLPVNLPDSLKRDNLPIVLQFSIKNTFVECPGSLTGIQQINIINARRK